MITGTLIFLLGVALYVIYNLIRKNTELTVLLRERDSWLLKLRGHIDFLHFNLKEIDSKGHFEADDEVGMFFKELKGIVAWLDGLIFIEDDDVGKTNKN